MTNQELKALIDKWADKMLQDEPYVYHVEVSELMADFMAVLDDDRQKTAFIGKLWTAFDRLIEGLKGAFGVHTNRHYMNFTSETLALLRALDSNQRLKEPQDGD